MSTSAIANVLAQADEMVITQMKKQTLAGLGLAIIHRGEVVYAKGFGYANVQQERAVTPDTVFRIASISKTVTALGLMQLWEQDKFQLDDPVNDYLKAYRLRHPDPSVPPVTFRHLLTHTSGLGTFVLRTIMDVVRPGFGLAVRPDAPIPPLREYYAKGLTTDIYPGTKWAYSNYGFATIGQLIEDISGEPFTVYMLRHVFKPLGMHATDYLRSERVRDQLSKGYRIKRGRLTPATDIELILSGAATIFSSVNDMAKYIVMLLNGGTNEQGTVVNPETLKMMMRPQYQIDERLPAAMGLAFWLDDFDGHRIAWHSGDLPGFMSAMYLAPDDGLGIVVFTNTSTMSVVHRPDRLATDLLRRLLGVPAPVSQLPRPGIMETPDLWPELSGCYGPEKGITTNANIWMLFGGEVEVLVKDKHLVLRGIAGLLRKNIPLYRVDAADPLVFHGLYDEQVLPVVFKRNTTGQIDSMGISFSGLYLLHKRPRSRCLRLRILAGLGGLASLIVAGIGWRLLKSRQRGRR